ncbi:MAG: hypothetical protein WCN95_13605 [bacterium]
MSKHSDRRERREEYHSMLDAELAQERGFIDRVVAAIDRKGVDIAPDGREIRADYWRYIASRQKTDGQAARAALHLVQRAVNSLRVRRA